MYEDQYARCRIMGLRNFGLMTNIMGDYEILMFVRPFTTLR